MAKKYFFNKQTGEFYIVPDYISTSPGWVPRSKWDRIKWKFNFWWSHIVWKLKIMKSSIRNKYWLLRCKMWWDDMVWKLKDWFE